MGLLVKRGQQALRVSQYRRYARDASDDDLTATSSSREDDMSISHASDMMSANEIKADPMEGFTLLRTDDRYSIPFGEGYFLWVAPTAVETNDFCTSVLVEIDISPFDRGKIL